MSWLTRTPQAAARLRCLAPGPLCRERPCWGRRRSPQRARPALSALWERCLCRWSLSPAVQLAWGPLAFLQRRGFFRCSTWATTLRGVVVAATATVPFAAAAIGMDAAVGLPRRHQCGVAAGMGGVSGDRRRGRGRLLPAAVERPGRADPLPVRRSGACGADVRPGSCHPSAHQRSARESRSWPRSSAFPAAAENLLRSPSPTAVWPRGPAYALRWGACGQGLLPWCGSRRWVLGYRHGAGGLDGEFGVASCGDAGVATVAFG